MLPALALLIAAQAPAVGLPTLRVGEGWGANLGSLDLTPTDETRLRDSGLKWVRRELGWGEVEKTKNVYDFAAWDRLLGSLAKAGGVRLVFVLGGDNPLYKEGEARAAFGRFVSAALARFRGKGVAWEIWDEPNGGSAPLSAQDDAALTNAVADVFAKEAPNEPLIGPALKGIDLPYLESLAKAGLFKRWSALSIHPLRTTEPETVLADIARLRILASRYGRPDLPILSTRWGYFADSAGMGNAKQADFAARQELALLVAGVPMNIWGDWTDQNAKENGFGLVYVGGRPKPAFDAIQTLNAALGGFRYRMRLASDRPEDWVLLFERDGRPALAAWTTGAPHEAEVYPGVKMNLTSRPQTNIPERRSHFLDAALALPSVPPFIAYESPDEAARLLRSVQSSLPPGASMEVRLNLPVIGPKRIELRAGELGANDAVTKFLQNLPRSPEPVRLRLAIPLEGGDLRQETMMQSSNPLTVEIRPKADGTALFAVRAAGGFDGTIKIIRGESTETKPLKLADGEEATFPIPTLDMPSIAAFVEDGRTVLVTESARYVPVRLDGLSATTEGNDGVYGRATVADAPAEAGYPGAKEIAFDLRKGQKYVLGALPEPKIVPGRPTAYGLWVNGDASGATLTFRLVDANGQTIQPAAVPIDWTGWRYVRFPIGVDLALPVRITAPFLLDSPGDKGAKGTIRLAGASVTAETD